MKCQQCKYYVIGDLMGQCNRYPKPISKGPSHWCGEFVEKQVVLEVVPEVVQVATGEVVEIKKRGRKPNANKGTE